MPLRAFCIVAASRISAWAENENTKSKVTRTFFMTFIRAPKMGCEPYVYEGGPVLSNYLNCRGPSGLMMGGLGCGKRILREALRIQLGGLPESEFCARHSIITQEAGREEYLARATCGDFRSTRLRAVLRFLARMAPPWERD